MRSTVPIPVRLSVATLQTELTAINKKPEKVEIRDDQRVAEEDSQATAFWTAWHSHKEYLVRLSMVWMNVSAADAEDAFSDATIRAYEKYATHASHISNERAWFARLLHIICIDKHRANKRVKNLCNKVKEIKAIDMSALDTQQQTPEGNLLNAELGNCIRAAIDALPERLKAPVILRLVQGEEYDDIARRLGISNDNVRKRVQQGRSLLRESLKAFRER
jgi:RNA polymerase sigma-70 factor (ECF subfamily)